MWKYSRHPHLLPEPAAKTMRLMWAKVQIPDACWEWTGSLHVTGYPRSVNVNGSYKNGKGKMYRPQRLFFHWFKFPIPDGLTIDHLCKNRKCVNPDHMELVTHEENASRGNKAPYCKYGHPLADPNLYYYNSNGRRLRRCLACIKREREQKKSQKKRKRQIP